MPTPGNVLKRIETLEMEIARLKKRTTFGGGGVPTGIHSTTHEDSGADPVDVTTLAGFPNGSPATLFLREDATWAEPIANSNQPITPVSHGNSGATLTLDWDAGTRHLFTLDDDVVLTLSNPIDGAAYVVVIDTGAGGFAPTWPGTVLFPDDTPPDTSAAGISVLVTLLWVNDLTAYIGSFNSPYTVP